MGYVASHECMGILHNNFFGPRITGAFGISQTVAGEAASLNNDQVHQNNDQVHQNDVENPQNNQVPVNNVQEHQNNVDDPQNNV